MATSKGIELDEIGPWSEIKLDILKEYAPAYSKIMTRNRLSHAYIDGFCGAGEHRTKRGQKRVLGSPAIAIQVLPPFRDYYLIDLKGDKLDHLHTIVGSRPDVHLLHGNCNQLLLDKVFPEVRYEDFRRGLCILDPYALHLDWKVVLTAGKMKSLDLFLNFPIMDMNRNILWTQAERVDAQQAERMTTFWGDTSWRKVAYRHQQLLFGEEDVKRRGNEAVVAAFRERLRTEAGFAHVAEPLAMRNSKGAVVYYLFFASPKPVADKIVRDIFTKYRDRSA
jgi:three-Cys-motif partner protein